MKKKIYEDPQFEPDADPYMLCTNCQVETPVRASEIGKDLPPPLSRLHARAQGKMLATLAVNWRCGRCLDDAEAAERKELI